MTYPSTINSQKSFMDKIISEEEEAKNTTGPAISSDFPQHPTGGRLRIES